MAWVPIVLPPSCGCGYSSKWIPPEKRPAYAYYERHDVLTNIRYKFKWYYNQLKDVEHTMEREGYQYNIYAVEQDDIIERVVYNKNTGRFQYTGELIWR